MCVSPKTETSEQKAAGGEGLEPQKHKSRPREGAARVT
jgi:hypothetical protein